MQSHIHRAPNKAPPHTAVQRFFVGQHLELLDATVVGVCVKRESAPSSDVIRVQYACCEQEHQTRGSELQRKLKQAARGELAHPTRCPACAKLRGRAPAEKKELPFDGGPRWAVPESIMADGRQNLNSLEIPKSSMLR